MSVSVRSTVADDSTAASLVPRIFTVTESACRRRRHRERVGVGRPGNELVVGRVRRVAPGAVRVDRERAVAPAVPACATKCHRCRRRCWSASRRCQRRIRLGQVDRRRRQHRRVVGAQDIHRHRVSVPSAPPPRTCRYRSSRHRTRRGPSSPCSSRRRRVDRERAVAPAVPVCATKVSSLSTSVIVSVPPVVSAALVSFRFDRRRRQHRRVVGAEDVHRHRGRRAVGARHRERVGVGRPNLNSSWAESPCSSRRRPRRSRTCRKCRPSWSAPRSVVAVDVRVRQLTAGRQRPLSVSVRLTVADDSTAASLVPRIFTVTESACRRRRHRERVG